MFIRRATQQDSSDILSWRNNAHARAMFINQQIIPLEEHTLWFQNVLIDPSQAIFIGEQGGDKIGMCRFEIRGRKAEVGINLNPAARGKGLCKPLLSQSMEKFWELFPQMSLIAKVKNENLPSLKCFENVGFQLEKKDANFHYFLMPHRWKE